MLPTILKDRLLQVQEELTSSLRTFVLAPDSASSFVTSSRNARNLESIRLDAGADLLNNFQFHWCRMREASERNYKLAEEADKAIYAVAAYVNRQHATITSLTQNLSLVSHMTEQLQKLNFKLVQTENILLKTEQNLAVLEDLLEDVELEKRMREYEHKTDMMREQKLADLEQLKKQLAMEHAMKVKEHEVKQMIKAKERQAVFEQVFEAEIQQYKTSGILPKSDLPRSGTTSLEEVVVEDVDTSALDQFLDD